MKKLHTILVCMILLPVLSLSAKDFGLLLDQGGTYSGGGGEKAIDYRGTLIPWFSAPLGSNAELYISAGFTADYGASEWKFAAENWNFVPELLRTEFRLRVGENANITLGRMSYTDPLGFIAAGLFDGGRFALDFSNGSTLGAGAWYTGFLYKKNAQITMTMDDLAEYHSELDYSDFAGTYFAPRRALVALDWEHPGILELVRLRAAFLGQFDFTDSETPYHSQYLAAKATVPVNQFVFHLGGVVEMAEMGDEYRISLAGELGAAWMLPTPIADSLSFLGRFSGGTFGEGETFAAFVPVTTEPQGYVLSEKISGLSTLQLNYTARLHQTLSVGVVDSYFVLSDLGTYQGRPLGRDGYFLGNEIYGFVTWNPLSDLRIIAGGGAFLPSLGNADKEADPMWKINLNVVLALF